MFRTSLSRIAPVIGILLVAGAMTVFGDARDTFHETYRIAPGTPVSVDNTNGNVEISTWDEDHAEVHAELRTRRDRDELELIDIVVESDGVLRIETKRSRRESSSNDSLLDRLFGRAGAVGRWPQVDVDYRIRLPRSAEVTEVTTVNGTVQLEDTAGNAHLRTTNGNVEIRDHTGNIRARSTNGRIETTGSVSIVEARTTNGGIDVEIGHTLTESATIETVNGSISVVFPENLNAALDIRTVNGGIDAGGLTIKLEKISKHQLIGTLGSGGPSLTIKTVNGGVDLHTR